jgi:hypothetical protein
MKILDTLTSELMLSHNGWIVDDAVVGCLLTDTALDFLADFGLGDTTFNRRLLNRAINRAIDEGF